MNTTELNVLSLYLFKYIYLIFLFVLVLLNVIYTETVIFFLFSLRVIFISPFSWIFSLIF